MEHPDTGMRLTTPAPNQAPRGGARQHAIKQHGMHGHRDDNHSWTSSRAYATGIGSSRGLQAMNAVMASTALILAIGACRNEDVACRPLRL
jgi:hypothetical protein